MTTDMITMLLTGWSRADRNVEHQDHGGGWLVTIKVGTGWS